MKTFNRLYPQIWAFDNLVLAAQKARKGKRFKPNVARFELDLEKELLALQSALRDKTWTPGDYSAFYIHEPKKRLISAAPYRDRVVHHALMNIIEPLFERRFIYDSYANRKNKGTHRAVDRFQSFARKYHYVLKCDIQKFFPSIDHEILKAQIRRTIACRDTLWLIDLIIDSSNPQEPVIHHFPGDDLITPIERRRGLPIGNLTSQFFANVYLDRFDHHVKEHLKCRAYVRYVDDFVILNDDKTHLHNIKHHIETELARLRLRLHPDKCQVFPAKQGTDFLGYRIFPTRRKLRRDSIVRIRRRLKKLQTDYANGHIDFRDVDACIQAWIAHAEHAQSYRLRQHILSSTVFQRAQHSPQQ